MAGTSSIEHFIFDEMTTLQHLHYTIDSFELNYEATSGIITEAFTKRMRTNKTLQGRIKASPVVYDTICFSLPKFFTESRNPDKCIEIEYIHLLQRPDGVETTETVNADGTRTVVERNVEAIVVATSPAQRISTKTTNYNTAGEVTSEETTVETTVSDDTEWLTVPSTMHSDLVQFRSSADSYVMSTNVMYQWQKKFVIPHTQTSFDLWFRDMNGRIIDMNPTRTRVIIELLLTY